MCEGENQRIGIRRVEAGDGGRSTPELGREFRVRIGAQRELRISGGEAPAGVEGDVIAQIERERKPVVGQLPGLGQNWLWHYRIEWIAGQGLVHEPGYRDTGNGGAGQKCRRADVVRYRQCERPTSNRLD